MKLLYFSAPWCGPCKMFKPVLKSFIEENSIENFVSIDIDEEPEMASLFSIKSVPTLILMKGEEEIKRLVGAQSKVKLEEFVNE